MRKVSNYCSAASQHTPSASSESCVDITILSRAIVASALQLFDAWNRVNCEPLSWNTAWTHHERTQVGVVPGSCYITMRSFLRLGDVFSK